MTDTSPEDAPTTVAILGLGSMGRAILAGLLSPSSSLNTEIRVTNTSAAKAAEWVAVPEVTAFATESNERANRDAVAGARIVIGAVKPWQMNDLLDEIAPKLASNAVFVSVAAGITTEALQAHLPEHVSVLRAMPNTPALVGKGVTGLVAGSRASVDDLTLVTELFESVGEVVVVSEEQMDALGAISGSGPAYVFYFIEQFMNSARAHGFSEESARTLVLGTFSGAAELLERSGEEPAELRRRVTSPKGTTEQAIAVLEQAQLGEIFERALAAAIKRSEELASGAN